MPSIKNHLIRFLLGLSLIVAPVTATPLPVKQSSSGLCHTEQSPYYDRTSNYLSYENLESCLNDGGKAQSKRKLTPASEETDYKRSNFGPGWNDEDGDCQNSRMEALISQSTRPPIFASADRCRVVRGRWVSPFTGNVIQDASKIDVDHIVPLKFAWEHGADSWSQQKREQFSNDPVNLWSVEAGLNRSKGAQGPIEWLPPSGECQYISRFLRIIKLYNLQLGAEEIPQYETLKSGCGFRSR